MAPVGLNQWTSSARAGKVGVHANGARYRCLSRYRNCSASLISASVANLGAGSRVSWLRRLILSMTGFLMHIACQQ